MKGDFCKHGFYKGHCDDCDELAALRAELDAALARNRQFVCVYCGETYERGDNPTEAILAHFAACEKHPVNALGAKMKELVEERDAAKATARILANAHISSNSGGSWCKLCRAVSDQGQVIRHTRCCPLGWEATQAALREAGKGEG